MRKNKGNLSNSIKNKKYIMRRAKNGKVREKHVSAACYLSDKEYLKKEAKKMAIKMGYKDMSISSFINFKILLPH